MTPGEWPVDRQTDGLIRGRVYPNLENLVCVVAAPGHRVPEYRVFIVTQPRWPFGSSRVADLGVIDLGDIVQEKPRANPADIQPADAPLPGINQPGRY